MVADSSPDQREVITASEILGKIERGEDVEYDGVIVEGDLDISGLDLPTEHVERTERELQGGLLNELTTIRSLITITNSEIRGNLNFSNANLQKCISFKETRLIAETHFMGAEFDKDVEFGQAKFSGYVDFWRAKFGGNADFWNAKFKSEADFSIATFRGNAHFIDSEFEKNVYFMRTEFNGSTAFTFAKLTGDSYFGSSKLMSDAYFVGTRFSGEVKFEEANFRGNATFKEAEFGGNADFLGANFDKTLILEKLKFRVLFINWSQIKNSLVYDGHIYLALTKNFKIIEQFNDADNCYYQYRKESQTRKKWYSEENRLVEFFVRCYNWISTKINRIFKYLSWINNYPPFTWIHRFNWSKLLDWIGFVSCGYGVRIQPIILWVLGSVLGFTLLYRLLPQSYGGIAESGPSTVTMEAVNNSTLFFTFSSGDGAVSPSWGECLYFSFTALTGGTSDGLHPVGLCKYAVMFEGVLGYLFLALFVVVLARKIIR